MSKKILVIVESPGKINKIQHILGNDYIVMASYGHIIDLDNKNMSINITNNFEPIYQELEKSLINIKNLKNASKKAIDILLASDEDREGEMIAWSLAYVLKIKNPKRIIFNSITEKQLLNAIKNPKNIDYNLVDAQKTRRILDRIVGYEISPILSKKFNQSLSAGRVQSVVVRLLIDREKEIESFFNNPSSSFFKIIVSFFDNNNIQFNANLFVKLNNEIEDNEIEDNKEGSIRSAKIVTEEETKEILKKMIKSKYKISKVIDKEILQYPTSPYTTSTLQQEASRKLGFPIKQTMNIAQILYENGYITYMRTDSMNLSDEAHDNLGQYIINEFGIEYYKKENYTTHKQNTQEAHEAIRPTDITLKHLSNNNKININEIKLYDLIWKKTITSQMSPAKFNIKTIQISISKIITHILCTQIKTNIFLGFLIIYNSLISDSNKIFSFLPKLKINNIIATQEYKKPNIHYNEASLVNKLDPKNLNIGRPSTYATIINKIQEQGYVEKKNIKGIEKKSKILSWINNNESKLDSSIKEINKDIIIGQENNKFVATPLGKMITEYLILNFPEIMDYKFTATMETQLDDIADGKFIWYSILNSFYILFHPKIISLSSSSFNIINKKILGKDINSGNNIIVTTFKYGPVVMIENGNEKPLHISSIKLPLTLETITLNDALIILTYPKDIGIYKNKNIKLCKGQYGFYIKYGDINISLKNVKNFDENMDNNILLDLFSNLIDNNNILWNYTDDNTIYTVIKGPFSNFINIKHKEKKTKGINIKFPNDIQIKDLTIEKIKLIIKNHKSKK